MKAALLMLVFLIAAGSARASIEAYAGYDAWRTDNLPLAPDAPVADAPALEYPAIWYDPFAAQFEDFAYFSLGRDSGDKTLLSGQPGPGTYGYRAGDGTGSDGLAIYAPYPDIGLLPPAPD